MLLHCHCERPTGACLHAVAPVLGDMLPTGKRFGTQAWQSHLINKRLLRRFTPRNDALLNAFVLIFIDSFKNIHYKSYDEHKNKTSILDPGCNGRAFV